MNAVPLPTVNAGSDCGARHRAGGSAPSAAMASRICWNTPRETMTAAIWNVIDRPCRTIFAPIFVNQKAR